MSAGVSATPARLCRTYLDHLAEDRAIREYRGQAPAGTEPGDRHHHLAALVSSQAVASAQNRHRAERLQAPALGVQGAAGPGEAPPPRPPPPLPPPPPPHPHPPP